MAAFTYVNKYDSKLQLRAQLLPEVVLLNVLLFSPWEAFSMRTGKHKSMEVAIILHVGDT